MNLNKWAMAPKARVCSCIFSDMVNQGRMIWKGERDAPTPPGRGAALSFPVLSPHLLPLNLAKPGYASVRLPPLPL